MAKNQLIATTCYFNEVNPLNLKAKFISLCITEAAIKNGSANICKTIHNDQSRNSCYTGVAYKLADVSICDTMVEEGYKDDCYYYFGISREGTSEDQGVCDKIINLEKRYNCFMFEALKSRDISLCSGMNLKVGDDLSSDKCYLGMAETDSSLACEDIQRQAIKRKCYIKVKPYDMDVCLNYSVTEEEKDECFLRGVRYSGNYTICKNIQNVEIKDNCYRDAVAVIERYRKMTNGIVA